MFSAIAGIVVSSTAQPDHDAMPSVRDQMAVVGTGTGSLSCGDDVTSPVRQAMTSPGSLEHGRGTGLLALRPPRRTEADDLPHPIRVLVRDAPSQQSAEAPADDGDGLVVAVGDLDEPFHEPVDQPVGQTDVAAQPPSVDVKITAVASARATVRSGSRWRRSRAARARDAPRPPRSRG